MGSGKSVPAWVRDVQLSIEFGFTEKQLETEFTIEYLERMRIFLNLRAAADDLKHKQSALESKARSRSYR